MTFAWWHVLVALIPILPNLWSIWHIWNHRFSSFQQKAIWLVIAVPACAGGPDLYFRRSQARR